MFKLVLEKAEEPTGDKIANIHWIIEKAREFQKKKTPSISDLLTMPKPLTVWIATNCKIIKEMGIADHLTFLLRSVCRSRSNS